MEKQLPKNWVSDYLYNVLEPVKTGVKIYDGIKSYYSTGSIKDNGIFEEGIYDYYTKPSRANREVEIGDILQARMSYTDKALLVNESLKDSLFSTGFIQLRPFNKTINSKYVLYFLKSDFFHSQKDELASGTTQVAINDLNAKKIEFPLPPLAEQNRIVAKLDALFAQLETIKTSMAKVPLLLKDFRQQVLTQAITGKLTEEWRKGKEFKSPNADFVNNTLLKENKELNEIQLIEGRSKIKLNPIFFINKNEINWSVFTIESLCIVIVDCLHETATFSNDGYKLIDTNNIEPFKINKNKLRYVDTSVYKKWVSRLKPEYGDIVFTREGTIGNALMIPENDKYCIGQRTMLFRFSKLMSEKFCELYMNSEAFKNQVKPHIKGVASQHVNIRDLRLLEMPVPSFEEQQEIVSRVESLFAKADTIEKQYETLKAKIDTLPQAILHKAFKGELTQQLDSDGDARELLREIQSLRAEQSNIKKKGKKVKV